MKNLLKAPLGAFALGIIIYGCAAKDDAPSPSSDGGTSGTDGGAAPSSAGKKATGAAGEPGAGGGGSKPIEGSGGAPDGLGGALGDAGADVGPGPESGAGPVASGAEPPVVSSTFSPGTIVWKEDFEADAPDWSVTGGVWAIGAPTNGSGPDAFAGAQVAATGLAKDYANGQNAWLISPEIDVPAAKENPRVRFHYWYELAAGDAAYVAIRVDGGGWQGLSTLEQSGDGAWRQMVVNLDQYADHTVELGFQLYTNGAAVAPGFFIDDVIYEKGASSFASPQGFEGDWDYWSAVNGVWAFGAPTASDGPEPFEGKALAGTILSGDYQNGNNAWLVGPVIDVPPAKNEPSVSLKYWYELSSGDAAYVAISVDGGGWQGISTLTGSGDKQWYNMNVPLAGYADRQVQIGFQLYSNGSTTAPGFYVDDVRYHLGFGDVTGAQGFEQGWAGWSAYNGVWAIGEPTAVDGPKPHSGKSVAGTVLSGDYEPGHDAWLVSPRFEVPKNSQTPGVSYWYWYELAAGDAAYAAISVDGGGWQGLDTLTESGGDTWRQKKIDLTPYKDHVVQIGFQLYTNGAANTLGYYIDDVAIDLE